MTFCVYLLNWLYLKTFYVMQGRSKMNSNSCLFVSMYVGFMIIKAIRIRVRVRLMVKGQGKGCSQKLHVGGAWCTGPNPTPICLQSPTVLPSPLPLLPFQNK